MASSLDMSLDDRMKNMSDKGRGRGRRRGRAHSSCGSGTLGGGKITRAVNGKRLTGPSNGGRPIGVVRKGPLMVNTLPSSFAIAKSIRRTKPFPIQNDLFEDRLRAIGIQGVEVDTKLYVSNLDRGVTNEDITKLFSELGDLKRFVVHYDKNGHPTGSAEVVYNRRSGLWDHIFGEGNSPCFVTTAIATFMNGLLADWFGRFAIPLMGFFLGARLFSLQWF